jgi:hypothetical protein
MINSSAVKPHVRNKQTVAVKTSHCIGQTYTGCLKKTGIMEFCIFCIIKGGYSITITVSNTYLIKIYTIGYYSGFYSSLRDEI